MPNAPDALPFVETSVARLLRSRLSLTHDLQAISVLSGPWGIGKTTMLTRFRAENDGSCVVVKVRPGARDKAATAVAVLQMTVEALRAHNGFKERPNLGTTAWALRKLLFDQLDIITGDDPHSRFTLIFDEAQYISRAALDTLRFLNDKDSPDGPIPVGLFLAGNPELSLAEGDARESVISGAVRSRALFIEALDYDFVSDTDLVLFAQSRGVIDPAAIEAIVAYYDGRRVKRDLRHLERLLGSLARLAGDRPVTISTVRSLLTPA